MTPTTDPHPYLVLIASIASIGASIANFEWLANRRQLKDDGLYSWAVAGARPAGVGASLPKRALNWLLSYRPFVGVLIVRAIALALLPATLALRNGATGDLAFVVATTLLLNLRSPYGMDGSDQMAVQVFGALLIGCAAGSKLAIGASLCFIGAQACLSYFTSGVAKVLSPQWREGTVVFAIFNTRTYGYAPAARLLHDRPTVTRAATYGAVAMECAFPLVLFVGWPVCLVFIAWGVAFHVMNALVMGLNSFIWSFAATYPAVIYLSVLIMTAIRFRPL